ncbi:MAG TPA: hypothetical protein DEP53_19345 [Bacteroidetes bacterium]|nr:hypothetical protein [Bacteroidota bacterium]
MIFGPRGHNSDQLKSRSTAHFHYHLHREERRTKKVIASIALLAFVAVPSAVFAQEVEQEVKRAANN